MHPSPALNAVPIGELLRTGAAVHSEEGLIVHSSRTAQSLLITALTDLDGTANDEHEPEHRRLDTIGPASESFAALGKDGVVTGICTARSAGEALHYRSALKLTGPLICENGAVLILSDGSHKVIGSLEKLENGVERISARIGRYVPNSLNLQGLEIAWQRERRGESPSFLGHPDLESLRIAADRYGSCFLVGLNHSERVEAAVVAKELGLDCFGELLHLIDGGVSKGVALSLLIEHVEARFHDSPVNLVPIVFGNGANDLPLFERAIKAGGAAVLVGDARAASGFQFDIVQRPPPPETILLPGISHGYAIRKSLPRLAEFFATRYGIRFPW